MSEIKQILWGEESKPNREVSYNYVIGKTPIGRYLITWKGWKENPTYCVDKSPFEDYCDIYECTLEDVKKACQSHFDKKIRGCFD